MKKNPIMVATLIGIATLLPLQSCIGSFALTNKVLKWNNQVGSKFLNELVFFAFWIIPVYEVTSAADLIILNSIEFWSGNNPVQASVKIIDTEQGKYYIASDDKGYDITCPNGDVVRLDYDNTLSQWSVITTEGEKYPFMTMIDDTHVKMITPIGDFEEIEISEEGVFNYSLLAQPYLMAYK